MPAFDTTGRQLPPEGTSPVATAPVSLVISTRNRHDFVTAAVGSVAGGAERPSEIVIVDQSDRPHPALSASPPEARCEIRYIWSRRRGLSRGRNEGVRAARHDLLAFLDDDVLVGPGWLSAFRRALAANPVRSILTGRVLEGGQEVRGGFAPSVKASDVPMVYRGRVGEDVLLPNCMLVPRAVFDEVGLFDERLGAGSRFPSSEDNDFGFRALEAGCQIVYVPDAVAYHRAWRSPGAAVPLRFAYGRGQGAYFAKHLSRRDPYMLRRLWRDVVRHARRAPRRATSDVRGAAGDVVYAAAVVLGALEWSLTTRGRAAGAGQERR